MGQGRNFKDSKQPVKRDGHQGLKQDDDPGDTPKEEKIREEKDKHAKMTKHAVQTSMGEYAHKQLAKVVHKSKHDKTGKSAKFDERHGEITKREAHVQRTYSVHKGRQDEF